MTWELKSDIQQTENCMFLLLMVNQLENTVRKMSFEEIYFVQHILHVLAQNRILINLKSCRTSVPLVSNDCFP